MRPGQRTGSASDFPGFVIDALVEVEVPFSGEIGRFIQCVGFGEPEPDTVTDDMMCSISAWYLP